MKLPALLLSALTLALVTAPAAAVPAVGSVANNIAFSLGSATLTGGNFTTLTNSDYNANEGKVIVLCYYTPW